MTPIQLGDRYKTQTAPHLFQSSYLDKKTVDTTHKTREILDQFLKNLAVIEDLFKEILPKTRKTLLITNVGHRYSDTAFQYALTLSKSEIKYHEKKASKPLHITFNLENFILTINGKEALAQSLDLLIEKFQHALTDLEKKQASTYESAT